jgi:two-component system sensor histidine kinase YesM
MKKYKELSYRMQIFLASLLLITIPTTLLGLFITINNAGKINKEYNNSMAAILTQTSLMLDNTLQDAIKIADMPLLSNEVRKIMIKDYGKNYLAYAQDSSKFLDLFKQTNRLNNNLLICTFRNRYGYSFEYNSFGNEEEKRVAENIDNWTAIARQSPDHTYYGPLYYDETYGTFKKRLPIIKILLDGYDFSETGICYMEINFKPVEQILNSTNALQNTVLILNSDNSLIYSTGTEPHSISQGSSSLTDRLNSFTGSIAKDGSIMTGKIHDANNTYIVNGCYNKTTKWYLVQFINNEVISRAYMNSLISYGGIFIFSIILGLFLAYIISGLLTSSITNLCKDIDACDANNFKLVNSDACGSNVELKKLVSSFNGLNDRLRISLQQNYQIKLDEQKTRIQMLQFQINHHFLYNTLNVIKSIANIYNVKDIVTISECMSDLLRYNLEKFPLAEIREELQQIKRYLIIQNIRFSDRFQFDCFFPDDLLGHRIPSFILEPLVENSIEHGFSRSNDNCYISISGSTEGDSLHIWVADNGTGMSDEALEAINNDLKTDHINPGTSSGNNISAQGNDHDSRKKHHSIGLINVHQRIRSMYGLPYGISVQSHSGEGTIIDICIPINEYSAAAESPVQKTDSLNAG